MSLEASLARIVGPANVLADEAARRYASSDIFVWPDAVVADLVVRPRSTEETAQAVALLSQEGKSVVPRGAGLSYTAGVVPQSPAVVLDTARLDAIDIHAEDLYAVVGAGCTWEKLAAALKPQGLQAVQRSPISGSHSTVGGLASQNLPGGMDGVIGLTVVLADGTVARTGSAARSDVSAFQRYSGPDLTGLFLGDCGSFGIKTEVVLRLAPEAAAAAFASFGFTDGVELVATIATLMRRAPGIRAFAMDQAKGAAGTKVDAGEAAKILGAVVKGAGSLGQAVKDVAQLARGRSALDEHPWSLHLTAEAPTEAAARANLDVARRVIAAPEIDNVVPKTLRAKPYSIRGIVGPDGERWVPVHGVLPLSKARECMSALRVHLDAKAEGLRRAGVTVQWLVSSAGPYVTIEPMFYWRDALDPIQLAHLSERNRTRFSNFPENASARDLVRRLRGELREVFARHGAVHAQVGRFYRLRETMDAGSRELLARIKHALDPDRRMNPGSLGF